MEHVMAQTTSRVVTLSRLGMAVLVALLLGTMVISDVDAKGNSSKSNVSIKKKVNNLKEICDIEGGTATVEKRPGGTSVSCSGGGGGDWTCVASSKKVRCYQELTNSPATNAGGGGAVPPGDNGNEDPSDGGADPGGGAHVPPSGGVDPNGGGSGDPVLE
jgi:hypothetical protein